MLYLTLIAIDRCIYWEKNTNINYVAEIATMGQNNYACFCSSDLICTVKFHAALLFEKLHHQDATLPFAHSSFSAWMSTWNAYYQNED